MAAVTQQADPGCEKARGAAQRPRRLRADAGCLSMLLVKRDRPATSCEPRFARGGAAQNASAPV